MGAAATVSSTFVSNNSTNNLTFAINVPDDKHRPDDFWFHLSGSNANTWVAVGFGHEMKNALMLVVYANKSGKSMIQNTSDAFSGGLNASLDVTLSRRVGTGHVEPISYEPTNSSIEILDGTGIIDGQYVVNAQCHNCRVWNRGQIDFASNSQPMVFAAGPDDLNLNSDASDAGLRRHDFYGSFNIDLVAAQGDPTPWPPADLSMRNATATGHTHSDHEYSSSVHAVVMAGTFVVIFPLGIFYMKILRNVRWHWIAQAFGVLVVIVGAALGLSMSRYYNRVSVMRELAYLLRHRN